MVACSLLSAEQTSVLFAFCRQGLYQPKIEVVDGSDSSDEDEDESPANSGPVPLIQDISPSSSVVHKPLIQEVPTSARKPLIEEVSTTTKTSLIQEVTAPSSKVPAEENAITVSGPGKEDDGVSLNEVVLETHQDQDSEDFLQQLGTAVGSGYYSSGAINPSSAQPSGAVDAGMVQALMQETDKDKGGEEDVEKDDGLGELD